MTTSETKGKSVPEILDERKALAAKGRCKTCQFCIPPPNEYYGTTHYCGIQGNVNPIHFTQEELDREQYPYGPCDDGNWTEINDDGSREQIYGCLAYMPKLVENVPDRGDLVTKQWAFMPCLAEAVNLHCAIEDAYSGKAQAKLSELLKRLNTGDFSGYSLY